jgi:SAM-dependent methyltransferase
VDWYDRAEVYDILFDWGRERERAFVLEASKRWGIREPRRILEPFCGSGMMLRAMPGLAVGLDINRHMLAYAGRSCRVFRADAAHFSVREAGFDLGLCLVDSFRHLLSDEEAHSHFRCMARALRPGAVYVLGFDLAGDLEGDISTEEWSAQRGDTEIHARIGGLGDADPVSRIETVRFLLDIRRGVEQERLEDLKPMRVYSRADFLRLLTVDGSFDIAAAFDGRKYNPDLAVAYEEIAGSCVLVLRRTGTAAAAPHAGGERPPSVP